MMKKYILVSLGILLAASSIFGQRISRKGGTGTVVDQIATATAKASAVSTDSLVLIEDATGTVRKVAVANLPLMDTAYIDRRTPFLANLGWIRTQGRVNFNDNTSHGINISSTFFQRWNSVTNETNSVTVASGNLTFDIYKSDGIIVAAQTVVPNIEWDNLGTLTALSTSTRAVAHRLFFNPTNNKFALLIGQVEHTSGSTAMSRFYNDPVVLPTALNSYVLVGVVIVQNTVTNYYQANTSCAILMASEFGQTVGGGNAQAPATFFTYVSNNTARDALTVISTGQVVGVGSDATRNNAYAEWRVLTAGATWATSTVQRIWPSTGSPITYVATVADLRAVSVTNLTGAEGYYIRGADKLAFYNSTDTTGDYRPNVGTGSWFASSSSAPITYVATAADLRAVSVTNLTGSEGYYIRGADQLAYYNATDTTGDYRPNVGAGSWFASSVGRRPQGGSVGILADVDIVTAGVNDYDIISVDPFNGDRSLTIDSETRVRIFNNISTTHKLTLKSPSGNTLVVLPPKSTGQAGRDYLGNYLGYLFGGQAGGLPVDTAGFSNNTSPYLTLNSSRDTIVVDTLPGQGFPVDTAGYSAAVSPYLTLNSSKDTIVVSDLPSAATGTKFHYKVKISAPQTINNSASTTVALGVNEVGYDPATFSGSSVVIQRSGWYNMTMNPVLLNGGAGGEGVISIGAMDVNHRFFLNQVLTDGTRFHASTGTKYLTAGTLVNVRISQTSGGSRGLSAFSLQINEE